MSNPISRRRFLSTTAGITTSVWALQAAPPAAAFAGARSTQFPYTTQLGWELGASQYTFRRWALYDALPKIAALGLPTVEAAFFLKLDAQRPALKVDESLSAQDRKQLKTRLGDHGIRMDSYYTSLTGDQAACRATFEFAKQMECKVLVAEPPVESFDMLEALCDEYKIALAIHNHPKPKSKYWDPHTVVRACQNRGPRIGACCDVGHWARTGLDVVASLKLLQGRIIEIHVKDIVQAGKTDAEDMPLGKGQADTAGVLRELHRQQYRGLMVIEYEKDTPKLMPNMRQCTAFVEQTARELQH